MSSSTALFAGRRFIIVGGGPVGLAVAVHLGRAGFGADTTVIERDASYRYCSALLSAGGMRQQYSLTENIDMSLYSASFLQDYNNKNNNNNNNDSTNAAADIGWKPHGYMFLASTAAQAQILQTNHATQQTCGAHWIQFAQDDENSLLAQRYPWLQTADLCAASFSGQDTGTQEGYFDPWGFMQCMKAEAVQQHGVLFVEGQVERVACTSQKRDTSLEPNLRIESVHVQPGKPQDKRASQEIKGIDALINCTGAWTKEFVRHQICHANSGTLLTPLQQAMLLQVLPVERRKRCIFFIHCPGKQTFSHPVPPADTPLTIDPTGVYFRPEGAAVGHFLCGVSPASHLDEDYTHDDALEHVDYHLFDDIIWPTLAHRVPAFNELRVQSAWSGFYDYNTLDQNAILDFHPYISNFVCAGGFSGHGLQMAPAAGRAVTELVLNDGAFQTLDLSNFSFARIQNHQPYLETGIV